MGAVKEFDFESHVGKNKLMIPPHAMLDIAVAVATGDLPRII
jgi:hypothetical protein